MWRKAGDLIILFLLWAAATAALIIIWGKLG